MEFKYNEETGAKAIEEYIIQAIRNLPRVKVDLNIKISYEPVQEAPMQVQSPDIPNPIWRDDWPGKYSELPPMLRVKDVQKFLQIGLNQAYVLCHSGQFRVIKFGRTIKVQKRDFIEWLEK